MPRTDSNSAAKPQRYATSTDFARVFREDMGSLHLLSFLLTADHERAEKCFVSGLDDCVEGNNVFREWARSWARRAIVQPRRRMPLLRTFLSSETSIALSSCCLSWKATPIRKVPSCWAAHGQMYVRQEREDYCNWRNRPLQASLPEPRPQSDGTATPRQSRSWSSRSSMFSDVPRRFSIQVLQWRKRSYLLRPGAMRRRCL